MFGAFLSKPRFTEGSISRHIIVMTSASTVALLGIFAVDLIDLFFLSLLGQKEMAASIGFAGVILFFMTAAGLGCQVAVGAIVARAEGAHKRDLAERYFAHSLIFAVLSTAVISLVTFIFNEQFLIMLGASGQTLVYAKQYVDIVVPSTALLALGMTIATTLRALGDAKGSMVTLLLGALVDVVLDPIFIFALDMGVQGAAIATVISRVVLVFYGLSLIAKRFNFSWRQKPQFYRVDLRVWALIAVPAMLTNLATPLGSSIVMKATANYGVEAVAGMAIVARIIPVCFAAMFSLSGAIGPIVGQNLGAGNFDRVRETLSSALKLTVMYVVFVWLVLMVADKWIIAMFSATGLAAELIHYYCNVLVLGFVFSAMLFVSNAAYNNLGKAHVATVLNFSRSVFGILPAVLILAPIYGAKGVMAAEVVGQSVFGVVAYIMVFRVVNSLERGEKA